MKWTDNGTGSIRLRKNSYNLFPILSTGVGGWILLRTRACMLMDLCKALRLEEHVGGGGGSGYAGVLYPIPKSS